MNKKISLENKCGSCIYFKSEDGVNGMCRRPKIVENNWRAYKVRTSNKCNTYQYNEKELLVKSLKPEKVIKPDYEKALDKACWCIVNNIDFLADVDKTEDEWKRWFLEDWY